MKTRYLLFWGDKYYPGQGWEDYHGFCESIEAARETINKDIGDENWGKWWQIINGDTLTIVEEGAIF